MGGAARRRQDGQGARGGQAALGAANRNQATGTAEPGRPAPGAACCAKPGPASGTAAARSPCPRGAGGARRPARRIQDTERSQATGAAKDKHPEAAHREQAAGAPRGTAAEAGDAEARHDRPTERGDARTRKGQGRQGGRKTLERFKIAWIPYTFARRVSAPAALGTSCLSARRFRRTAAHIRNLKTL